MQGRTGPGLGNDVFPRTPVIGEGRDADRGAIQTLDFPPGRTVLTHAAVKHVPSFGLGAAGREALRNRHVAYLVRDRIDLGLCSTERAEHAMKCCCQAGDVHGGAPLLVSFPETPSPGRPAARRARAPLGAWPDPCAARCRSARLPSSAINPVLVLSCSRHFCVSSNPVLGLTGRKSANRSG